MTFVKDDPPPHERHVALLMGLVFGQLQRTFAEDKEWTGVRQSHLRVISLVPPAGVSVTDLARRAGMTKQGCGQFVTKLVDRGLLRTEADPEDRRVRWVRRTDLGERTIAAATARILEIEGDWADAVGRDRYTTFRSVLEELAQPPAGAVGMVGVVRSTRTDNVC